MKKAILFTVFLLNFFFLNAQTPKIDMIVAGKTISYKTLKSKTKLITIKIKDILENRKLELTDNTYVVEKYTFFISVNGKLIELKESGSMLTDDVIGEIKELDSSKDKKFNAYIDDIVALHDEKEVKIPVVKFILEK